MSNGVNIEKLARSSKKSAFASLAGIAIVVLAIAYSLYMLSDLQDSIDLKQQELAEINIEKSQLIGEVKELEVRLQQTMSFDKNRYQIDWDTRKMLASDHETSRLLDDIYDMVSQNVPWKRAGTSPESGFDSPSFAAYLLIKKYKILDVDFSQRYKLRDMIPETDDPKNGDLAFFDTGYTMFYFRDQSGHPFCIGMTPLGIAAVEIDFGPRLLKYGRIDYR